MKAEPKFKKKDNLQVNSNLQINSTTNLELTYRLSFFSFTKLGLSSFSFLMTNEFSRKMPKYCPEIDS